MRTQELALSDGSRCLLLSAYRGLARVLFPPRVGPSDHWYSMAPAAAELSLLC